MAVPAKHEGKKLPDEMEKEDEKDTEEVIDDSEEEKGFDVFFDMFLVHCRIKFLFSCASFSYFCEIK